MHKNHYTLTANLHILAYNANSKELNVGNINERTSQYLLSQSYGCPSIKLGLCYKGDAKPGLHNKDTSNHSNTYLLFFNL